MKLEIIRKLGYDESMYDHELMHTNMFVSRIFLLKIAKQESLVISEDLLKKVSQIWARMFPLLHATIHREHDDMNKLCVRKYFVPMSKDMDKCENVKFIDLSTSHLEWRDVIQSELKTPFDFVHGPLWRIKLLILSKHEEEASECNYAFVLSKNHALGDGRCAYTISLAYLNILGDVLGNTNLDAYTEIKEHESKATMEDLISKLKSNPQFKISVENKCDRRLNRIPRNQAWVMSCILINLNANH